MRNFEERKAEIFRRSKVRIRQRRQVSGILCCIPVLVCAVMVWALLSRQGPSQELTAAAGQPEFTTEAVYGATPGGYTGAAPGGGEDGISSTAMVEFSDGVLVVCTTDPEAVRLIQDCIAYMNTPGKKLEEASAHHNGRDPGQVITYTLNLIQSNGSVTHFTFCGNTLTNLDTGKSCSLPDSYCQALYMLLGGIS